eukprot:scaffold40745_cov77-Cyclotella_meneghiniana.AAC.1
MNRHDRLYLTDRWIPVSKIRGWSSIVRVTISDPAPVIINHNILAFSAFPRKPSASRAIANRVFVIVEDTRRICEGC